MARNFIGYSMIRKSSEKFWPKRNVITLIPGPLCAGALDFAIITTGIDFINLLFGRLGSTFIQTLKTKKNHKIMNYLHQKAVKTSFLSDVMISKIFSPKNSAKSPFFALITAKVQKLDHNV
jgi:hypothetical protein